MNISRIIEAVEFAVKAHNTQRRKFVDEPYVAHPIRVAEIVAELTQDEDAVIAALLHDVLEDTQVKYEEIEDRFGFRVAFLVYELTDVSLSAGNRAFRKKVDCARLGNASPLAQTIKCVDILDNTDSIVDNDPNFGKRYLVEVQASLDVMTNAGPIRSEAQIVVDQARERLYGDENVGC